MCNRRHVAGFVVVAVGGESWGCNRQAQCAAATSGVIRGGIVAKKS